MITRMVFYIQSIHWIPVSSIFVL